MAGRKNKYETHVLPKLFLVECWARDGLTDEQIAKNLGVAVSTFCKYKNEFTEFSEALKKGKEVIDYQVENALLKRALGYEYEETSTSIEDESGRIKKKATKTKKFIPPDVTAQIFWLKNRRPDKWRDKPSGDDNSKNDIDDFLKATTPSQDSVAELFEVEHEEE